MPPWKLTPMMSPSSFDDEEGRSLVDNGEECHLELTENGNSSDDNYESEAAKHMVNHVDPYAVDFQPVFVGLSGNAVNYHSQESFHVSEGGNRHNLIFVREKLCRLLEFVSRRMCSFSRASKVFPYQSTKTKEGKEADSYNRCVVFGMGFLAFVIVTSARMRSVTSHKMEGTTVFKSLGLHHQRGGGVEHAPVGTLVPSDIQHAYRDVDNLPLFYLDTPVFWHIPRSGGTTMKHTMSMCMGKVLACGQGEEHELDGQLEILHKPYGNFTNVDTSTPLGIERAAKLGLIQSRMADVVVTPHLHEATKLFDKHYQGRLFTLLRDPVDRLASLYYFLRIRDQDTSTGRGIGPEVTLVQFAERFSENWMVRTLTNTMEGPLDIGHLHIAKEILRTKVLIGILEEKPETLRRIEAYFGWKLPSRQAQTCRNNMFFFEPQSKNIHDPVDPNSREYEVLKKRNHFDVELYEYAKLLFKEQTKIVPRLD